VASPARHVPPEGRAIGFVLQDYALFPHLNVRDNVLFGMPKKTRPQRLARVDELLENVGMSDFARAMPHTLSGGQQQRVALARALAREPVVMLLDEPFSGLDARLRGEIRAITVRVLRAARVATLLVTHDPQEALLVSDVVSVMRASRVEQTGTPAELYFQPQTLHVAEVFGYANCLAATVSNGGAHTPWGSVPVPEQPEGTAVRVLLRPECLLLDHEAHARSSPAVVHRQCLRGETATVELTLPAGQTLIASVPSHCAWPPGSTAHVSLVPQSAIVLPETAC
jgi:iron(III) transport system ATP-binding protein